MKKYLHLTETMNESVLVSLGHKKEAQMEDLSMKDWSYLKPLAYFRLVICVNHYLCTEIRN